MTLNARVIRKAMNNGDLKDVALMQICNGDQPSTSHEKAVAMKEEVKEEVNGYKCRDSSYQTIPSDYCFVCGQSFEERSEVFNHLYKYHINEFRECAPFHCDDCLDFHCYHAQDMESHSRSCPARPPADQNEGDPRLMKTCSCPYCGHSKPQFYALNYHIRKDHQAELAIPLNNKSGTINFRKPFMCTVCNKSFGTVFGLWRHWQSKEKCEGDVRIPSHEEYKNAHAEVFKPLRRSKRWKIMYEDEEVEGLRIETSTKQEPCEYCGEMVSVSALPRHMEKYHPEEASKDFAFPCELCGDSFTTRGGLLRHIIACRRKLGMEKLSKWNPQLLLPVACPFCRETTEDCIHLSKHIMYHHKKVYERQSKSSDAEMKKPFSCSMCDFSTMSPFSLSKHWDGDEDGKPCPGELILLTAEEAKYQNIVEAEDIAPKRAKIRRTAYTPETEQSLSLFSIDAVVKEEKLKAPEESQPVPSPPNDPFVDTVVEELDDDVIIDHMMESVNCPICEEECSSFFNLGEHLPSHSIRLCFFKCSTCGQGFRTPDGLKNHLLRRNNGILFCMGKGKVVSLAESKVLSGQVTRAIRMGRRMDEDDVEDSAWSSILYKKKPMEEIEEPSTSVTVVMMEKELPLEDILPKRGPQLHVLLKKMQPEMNEAKLNVYDAVEHLFCRVDCPSCGETCVSFMDVQRHYTATHIDDEDQLVFWCDGCGKEYKSAERLRSHLLQQHRRGVKTCHQSGKAIMKGQLKKMVKEKQTAMTNKSRSSSDDRPMVAYTTRDPRDPTRKLQKMRLPRSSFKVNNKASQLSVGQAIRDAIFNVQVDQKEEYYPLSSDPMQIQMESGTSQQCLEGSEVKEEVEDHSYYNFLKEDVKEERI